jgi:DNA-binding NarL/FixJ family response regulator
MRSNKPQRARHPNRHRTLRARSPRQSLPPRAPAERATAVLTPRQHDVANLLVGTGLSYKEIAAHLAVSEGTIRKHTEHIYRAFGVHSRPELTITLRASPPQH